MANIRPRYICFVVNSQVVWDLKCSFEVYTLHQLNSPGSMITINECNLRDNSCKSYRLPHITHVTSPASGHTLREEEIRETTNYVPLLYQVVVRPNTAVLPYHVREANSLTWDTLPEIQTGSDF